MPDVAHRCRHRIGGSEGGGLGPPAEWNEGFKLGDAYSAFQAAFRGPVVEGLKFDDTPDGDGQYFVAIADGFKLGDSVFGFESASLTEGLVLGETKDGSFVGINSPEGLIFGDTVTSIVKMSITVGLVLGDPLVAAGVEIVNEGLLIGDQVSSLQRNSLIEGFEIGEFFIVNVKGQHSEGFTLGDRYQPKFSDSITEGLVLGEETLNINSRGTTDVLILGDSIAPTLQLFQTDGLIFGESYDLTIKSLHSEGLVVGEEITAPRTIPASLTDGLVVGGGVPVNANAVELTEGIEFGSQHLRFPYPRVHVSDSFARNNSITGCADSCDIPELGDSDGLGYNDVEHLLQNISDFTNDEPDGWTSYNQFSWSGGAMVGSCSYIGSGADGHAAKVIDVEDRTDIDISYDLDISNFTGGATQVTVDFIVDGSIVDTQVFNSDDSWTTYTTSASGVDGGTTLEIKAYTDTGTVLVKVDNVIISDPNLSYSPTPMPYRMTGRGPSGTLQNTGGVLRFSPVFSNSNTDVFWVYWDLTGADSGDARFIPDFRNEPWWIHAHFSNVSHNDIGFGLFFKEGNNYRFYGQRYWNKFVGPFTLSGNNFINNPGNEKTVSATGSEFKIWFKSQGTNGGRKMRLEDVTNGNNYDVSWGPDDEITGFGIGCLVFSGETVDVESYMMHKSENLPLGFPQDF